LPTPTTISLAAVQRYNLKVIVFYGSELQSFLLKADYK